MPRNRKIFIHNSVVEITFRAEEELPLVATGYMKLLFAGILAQAQTMYPIRICHYVVMGNHVHMLAVVDDPECIPAFAEYTKRESSHVINRLNGRRKRTVWCDGYDSPTILDPEKVIQRIVYIYTNPSRAGLVEAIEEYPNLNSWQDFLQGGGTTVCNKVPRYAISKLPDSPHSALQAQAFSEYLIEQSTPRNLVIEPDAWLECFESSRNMDPDTARSMVIREVKAQEQLLRTVRRLPVVGAEALQAQDPRMAHRPKTFGKRMICLSSQKSLRIQFLEWYRTMADHCTLILRKANRRSLKMNAPGFFHPGGYMLANLSPPFSPLPLS